MKPRHSRQRRAVITGIGPVTAVGIGKEALWDAVIKGRSGVGRVSFFDTSALHAHHAAEIPDWDPAVFFSPQRLKRLDRYAQFAVASALLALEDARLPWSRETPQDRVGVSFGTALGGIAHAEREHTAFVSGGPKAVSQTLALTVFGGSAHANIAIECGFRGPGTTNSNSCASGAVSVGEALRYIRDDMADVTVAGAAEASICRLTYGAFDFIKTMSRWNGEPAAHAYQPFDLHRQGFVMGEGAASLVIEEYEHALRRGAFIYAEVLGYGLSNEAYHMTSPLPGGASVIRCMRDTLADAGLQPDAIDYINAHASGTQMNDKRSGLHSDGFRSNAAAGKRDESHHGPSPRGNGGHRVCAVRAGHRAAGAPPHATSLHPGSAVLHRRRSQRSTARDDPPCAQQRLWIWRNQRVRRLWRRGIPLSTGVRLSFRSLLSIDCFHAAQAPERAADYRPWIDRKPGFQRADL